METEAIAEHVGADRFAATLTRRLEDGHRTTVTWLNHYSAQVSKDAGIDLSEFDFIGIDGLLLKTVLGEEDLTRTSADLVLPRLIGGLQNASIAIVGGTEDSSKAAAKAVEQMLSPGSKVVFRCSGYGSIPSPQEIVDETGPVDLLIVGLGAPRQDHYMMEAIKSSDAPLLSITCGGWLDQVHEAAYYPPWAYKYRLNWLVRLYREPTRLWRRYTIDAVKAWSRRAELADWIRGAGGFAAHREAAKID